MTDDNDNRSFPGNRCIAQNETVDLAIDPGDVPQ